MSSTEFHLIIQDLTKQALNQQPDDILQFCSNYFNRRLHQERQQFLAHKHPHKHPHQQSPPPHPPANSGATPQRGMAQTTFPGQADNLFGASSGMHRLEEEDENDNIASPTASHFPRNTIDDGLPPAASGSAFGNFTGFGAKGSGAPPSSGPVDPQFLPSNYNLNRRTSVSAESLNPTASADDNWKPPHHDKTADQNARLRKAVAGNFLFSHLDDEQSAQVLGALVEKPIPAKGIKVIQQGDAGDFFYIVESGNFDIHVNKSGKVEAGPDGIGEKVASCGPGTSFGELALMYNAPRAATVVSTEPSMLWALDRVTFRRILMDSAFQRRRMYENFLEEVPLLATLKPYERSKIADALETQKFPPGSTIIKEGDPGESFFILESGEADTFKAGSDKSVRSYTKGGYFGELALLNDAPRAASVVAKTEVKVATLGKDGFQRLLGPVESIMRRNDPSKEKIEEDDVDPLANTDFHDFED